MFQCHINVEVCNSIKAIKYVIKYVSKGTDMAAFALTRNNPRDEVDLYQAARYVSCSEACWRLFGFSIHERYPAVVTRQVAGNPPKTTLTAYFELCKSYRTPEFRDPTPDEKFVQSLLYVNVPEYFVFDSSKTWKPRRQGRAVTDEDHRLTNFKRSSAIGRVYTVHPKQDECFFVRLLLHTVKGCCSFGDLRTVNGEVKPIFKEACRCLDLLEDDSHWISAIEEAAVYANASSLRTLLRYYSLTVMFPILSLSETIAKNL
ncbi:uncharacterized protein LOC134176977 [Corticium candelabrum]|uniref:uncharacterized protein LOC134176977 n=1 Tax=Corticium candelabrum TaxID=121492 RepID=UPI002E269677|nr:uncharacterized protein LOC134176977 [Corticium candelabrum]